MQHDTAPIAALLYEGALNPDGWTAGLQALTGATDSALFHHVAWDLQARCVTAGLTNEAQRIEKVQEYEQHHAPHDPRVPLIMGLPVGQVMLDHDYFTPREMSRSPIYADWLASHGLRHSLGVPVFDDGRTREWICLIRPLDHAAYGEDTRARLQRLMPDLLRAARVRARVEALVAPAALGIAGLDALPQAIAVVDARCKAHYLNAAARRSLKDADHGLAVRQGRLGAKHPAAQEGLAAQVAAACAPLPGAGTVCLRQAQHSPWLSVLPLQSTHPLAAWHRGEPMALLVWHPPEPEAALAQLAMLLGLSPAEARLALTLSRGLSVKDFAQAQGSSWHTARTQLRSALRKAGCHRQAELVQLVRSLLP